MAFVAVFALLALSVAFRWPPLLNAAATNSDAAIVGLQARHILAGEHSLFLFGSGYQTSTDAYVAAFFFAIFGPHPWVLMASTLAGHMALTTLCYATLSRALGHRTAFLLSLPLVFTTGPVHTYVLYPPRQAALTLVFASVYFLHRGLLAAPSRPGAPQSMFTGAALGSLAVYADPYALVFLPALVALAAFACAGFDRGSPAGWRIRLGRWRPAALGALGALVGAVPIAYLWSRPGARSGPRGMTLGALGHHAALFWHEALPWLLGARVYRGSTLLDYGPWDGPALFRWLGIAGAVAAVVAIGLGALALVTQRRMSLSARALGAFGCLVIAVTVAGFGVSVMVMDLFSARYLAAIALAFPFAIAPLAWRLQRARRPYAVLAFVAPYVAATGLSGWVGYGPFVDGIFPRTTATGRGEDVSVVAKRLAEDGIRFAIADYWTSYRFTFVAGESVVVVPLNAAEDRYRPYRTLFDAAGTIAYLHDSQTSRETFEEGSRAVLREGGDVAGEFTAGHIHGLIVRR